MCKKNYLLTDCLLNPFSGFFNYVSKLNIFFGCGQNMAFEDAFLGFGKHIYHFLGGYFIHQTKEKWIWDENGH